MSLIYCNCALISHGSKICRVWSAVRFSHNGHQKYFCDRCLCYLPSAERLHRYEEECTNTKCCKIILPKKTDEQRFIRFKNFKNKVFLPLAVYCDMEALLRPRCDDQEERVLNNHQAVSIRYYAKFNYNIAPSGYERYRQKDASDKSPRHWFTEELMKLAKILENTYRNIKPLHLTTEEEDRFRLALKCHICQKRSLSWCLSLTKSRFLQSKLQ